MTQVMARALRWYITVVHFVAMCIILYLLFVEKQYRMSRYGDHLSSAELQPAVTMRFSEDEIEAMKTVLTETSRTLASVANISDGARNVDSERTTKRNEDDANSQTGNVSLPHKNTLKGDTSILNDDDGILKHTKNGATDGKKFTIGLYSFYHGGLKFQARTVDLSSCEYSRCTVQMVQLTGSGPYDVDALLFQGNHVPPVLPVYRRADQVFVFFNTESPQHLHYTKLGSSELRGYFNWTMTYRHDSDIPYPYGRVVPSPMSNADVHSHAWHKDGYLKDTVLTTYANDVYENPEGLKDKDYEALFEKKTKPAAWLVSNCVTISKREHYIKAMQSTTNIHIFGACSNTSCFRKDPNCEKTIEREYKFYMAFENSLCKDYITEKVYKWFSRDIIVVARGADNYPVHLPKGTYVDADDFASASALARHLNKLATNKTEYIRMLKRKDSYRVVGHHELIRTAYCNLCERLHYMDEYRKTTDDINEWWFKNKCRFVKGRERMAW